MNFFEYQRQAQKNTRYLVFLFTLAVCLLVFSTGLATWIVRTTLFSDQGEIPLTANLWLDVLQYPQAYIFSSLLTLLVILLGATYKWQTLGTSGHRIAQYMGAIPVSATTKDSDQRKLLNVVEEMSIAAGMTPPPVYILPGKTTINAFAAGLTPSESVIAVTEGAIHQLRRDELQGVVAHEISHIIHGDTRLNVKLIGYLAGIVTIGLIGRIMLEMVGRGRYRSRSSNRSSKGGSEGQALLVIVGVGLTLFIIGYLGVFVGRMIRAAVSRQREFLADASAIQFTRFPEGLAGALTKINLVGSDLGNARSEEFSHMCFESPKRSSLLSFAFLSTHPPTEERIARIDKRFLDPEFVGKNVRIKKEPIKSVTAVKDFSSQQIVNSIGIPDPAKIFAASVVLQSTLPILHEGEDPVLEAKALILGLFNMSNKNEKIISLILTYEGERVAELFQKRFVELKSLPRDHVLATLELCIPTLREQGTNSKMSFLKTTEYLIKSDKVLDYNEVALFFILENQLLPTPDRERQKLSTLTSVKPSALLILSALADHGHQAQYDGLKSFHSALQVLGWKKQSMVSQEEMSLPNFRKAFSELKKLRAKDKETFFNSLLVCVEHDSKISANELEFLRSIAVNLEIPIPMNP
ncbi:MAG: M48 family metallopeptidase [Bdellovibrionales bacterium]|nr:M48 family metallopeptidase [Bdellovibrionales bacterium]